jgi:two-component system chemotaxis response regulator CheY
MNKAILIVDDSASIRQVVSNTLKNAGYEVTEAVDGKDGLTKLDGKKIHLIISDVNMPNMGGMEMVKAIKQMPTYKFTPIIMLTTEASDEMKQQGKAIGAKAWMIKPFKPEQMLHAVAMLT